MLRQVNRLKRLVDDLMDAVRARWGKMVLNRRVTSIAGALENAIETVKPFATERQHVLRVELPPSSVEVMGDPDRLVQVFVNLLTNAAKFTPPGGMLELVSTVEDSTITVRVRDNGRGIAPEHLAGIFEMFAQERADESAMGLGIGLALARDLVRLHGGSVEARSDGPGKGAEFTVTLPRHVANEEAGKIAEHSLLSAETESCVPTPTFENVRKRLCDVPGTRIPPGRRVTDRLRSLGRSIAVWTTSACAKLLKLFGSTFPGAEMPNDRIVLPLVAVARATTPTAQERELPGTNEGSDQLKATPPETGDSGALQPGSGTMRNNRLSSFIGTGLTTEPPETVSGPALEAVSLTICSRCGVTSTFLGAAVKPRSAPQA